MRRIDAAQRRPESEPRRHRAATPLPSWRPPNAQRRPESEPRRHRCTATPTSGRRSSLNEGRSLNPGDTHSVIGGVATVMHAQRRPESEPRRHSGSSVRPPTIGTALNEGRSLNPGDTSSASRPPSVHRTTAQRRPESEPRRHVHDTAALRIEEAHAQRRPESEPRRHPPSRPRGRWCRARPLNEGRSLNPGDTDHRRIEPHRREHAQRRPESEPRRHQQMQRQQSPLS